MKRFTETTKWQDEWFQELELRYKLFWIYICDQCDGAGVWKVNLKLACFQIGEQLKTDELLSVFTDRIEDIGKGRWWIRQFIAFQYGSLSEQCAPHRRVLELIANHGLEQRVGLPLRKGSQRVA